MLSEVYVVLSDTTDINVIFSIWNHDLSLKHEVYNQVT